ncbi:MAG: hypothetical protein JST81_08735 [Bacteroidetes bacterium]|nr:hypothetical protein [Bacteroidota bacterium]
MTLKEHLEKMDKEKLLFFYPGVEREMLFNFNAYKLKLALPLEKIRRIALPEEMLATSDQKKWHDFDKELINVDTVYLFSKADFEIFDKEKQVEGDKWIYKKGSLFLTITNPLFHKRNIIQDAKCWLTSSGPHLMNYINYVDSTLAFEYFNKK